VVEGNHELEEKFGFGWKARPVSVNANGVKGVTSGREEGESKDLLLLAESLRDTQQRNNALNVELLDERDAMVKTINRSETTETRLRRRLARQVERGKEDIQISCACDRESNPLAERLQELFKARTELTDLRNEMAEREAAPNAQRKATQKVLEDWDPEKSLIRHEDEPKA
jgi:hypothetical protein